MSNTLSSQASLVPVPDSDDVMLQLDPAFLAQLDWREGDTLKWEVREGSAHIENVSANERKQTAHAPADAEPQNPLFIVETIITHRIRYAVRAKSLEHAFDTVTMEEADEFDQNCVGESILGGRQVSDSEFLRELPDSWTTDQKLQCVHVVDYSKG